MKLIERINRTYFLFSTAVLALGTILFYLFISRIVREELDDGLHKDLKRITLYLEQGTLPPNISPVLEIARLQGPAELYPVFSDTMLYDPAEQEQEPFRQLRAAVYANGVFYSVCLRAPRVEAHDFALAVGIPISILLLLLLSGLFWLNRNAQRSLWQPFQQTLAALKNFSIAQPQPVILPGSDIEEFDALNRVLVQLTEKTRADYQNLREFTENASHEIQTPLAIIRAKTEWLLQTDQPDGEQAAAISAVYTAANRLSKLNQGLILLAKIENHQFEAAEAMSLLPILYEQMELLADIVQAKGYVIDIQTDGQPAARLHPALAGVLIKNLLENALRYSPPGSIIAVRATDTTLLFSNPGQQTLGLESAVFRRFARREAPSESPGLGLAIVKKIGEASGILVRYTFEENMHQFTLVFPE